MLTVRASLELPPWLVNRLGSLTTLARSDEERMEFAIDLARGNVAEGTGGPFAALVVEEASGECVAAGVNLVVTAGTSVAHAEAVAVMFAQRHTGGFDLAGQPGKRYTLYATGQPCIMCFGIVWWSGVTKLVCAARGEDVESIAGFREGPVPANWAALLAQRSTLPVEVVRDVRREAACDVLRAYRAAGHLVYNPGSSAGD